MLVVDTDEVEGPDIVVVVVDDCPPGSLKPVLRYHTNITMTTITMYVISPLLTPAMKTTNQWVQLDSLN